MRYMCDGCEDLFDGDGANPFRVASDQWATCPDCVKSERDGLIRTVARLEKVGSYAFPGGYPLVFFPPDGSVQLCFDCAKTVLEDGDGPVDYQVEDSDQAYYGGTLCDGCGAAIVDALCPECADELFDGSRILHADNVDASMIHARCAAKMVVQYCDDMATESQLAHTNPARTDHYWRAVSTNPRARRIPGIGVEIVDSEYGRAWYARPGTIYSYR